MSSTVLALPKLKTLVLNALDEMKAQGVVCLDVSKLTSITHYMIIATGSSSRQVKALANDVIEKTKAAGASIFGVEGQNGAEWVLVDLGPIVLHLMQAESREFYQLEKLWSSRETT